jgi:hypothetical protein
VRIVLENLEATRSRLMGEVIHEALTVEVESLPTDIPAEIVLDVSKLKEIGDVLHVSDLPAIEGVAYVSEPTTVIVRTTYIAAEETEEEEAPAIAEPELVSRRKEEEFEEEE